MSTEVYVVEQKFNIWEDLLDPAYREAQHSQDLSFGRRFTSVQFFGGMGIATATISIASGAAALASVVALPIIIGGETKENALKAVLLLPPLAGFASMVSSATARVAHRCLSIVAIHLGLK